ncbi:MAG: CoA-binding protein [Nitrospiraceae bacterium]|nr:CoA-binding protein [Nitrospiraceae bacterium]
MSEKEDLAHEFLRNENIIAVVGVSRDKSKYGNKVYHDLKRLGYKVLPINPNIDTIDNEKCYPSLKNLPSKPDVVNIVVPPKVTEKVVQEAYNLGIENIWMQPGSESQKAIEFCEKHNMKLLHNVCIMIKSREMK